MELDDLCNLDVLCVICLTGSEKNICLDQKLDEKRKGSPSILKAVERITAKEITIHENCPSVICPTCLISVNICYELIQKFQDTQKLLKEYFPKIIETDMPVKSETNFENQDCTDFKELNSTVDIKKYVEAECSDECLILQIESETYKENSDGIYSDLNDNYNHNLDTVNDERNKNKPVNSWLSEDDDLIVQDVSKIHYCCSGCQKIYGTIKNLKRHEENCVSLKFEGPENTERKKLNNQECKFVNISEFDQELFESAMQMKYSCDSCSKIYSSEFKLKKHQAICTKFLYNNREHSIPVEIQSNLSTLEPEINKSQPTLIEEINLDNLSQTEKDIFQSALKLQHKCLYCYNFFSSVARCNNHLKICRKRKKTLEAKFPFKKSKYVDSQ